MIYRDSIVGYFFFFIKQKTAYEMRISDWSSDVCSSDLNSLDALVDLQDKGLFVAQSQLDALRAIEAGINGVGNLLYRTNAPSGGPTPFNMPAQNDQVLGSFLGHVADGKYDLLNNRSEEHTSELQSLMRISYAVFCLK